MHPKTKQEFDIALGKELCKMGVSHDARWNDDVSEGYRIQCAIEQKQEEQAK